MRESEFACAYDDNTCWKVFPTCVEDCLTNCTIKHIGYRVTSQEFVSV